MNYKELKKLLKFNEKENNFLIPNEIFEDIIKMLTNYHIEQQKLSKTDTSIEKKRSTRKGSSTNHIAFTYSYYYLISWLYRYAKYDTINITKEMINEILGFAPKYRDANYIVKTNGLLDKNKFTSTTTNYPVMWEENKSEKVDLTFTLISEMDQDIIASYRQNRGKNYKVKLPIKAFNRHIEDEEMQKDYNAGYEDGFFFEYENTHLVPFEVFMFCMSRKEIGCNGFYLWCFLKSMNQKFKNGYDIALKNFEAKSGIKGRTVVDYLDALKKYNMVQAIHNQEAFCLSIKASERKANTYITNDYSSFTDEAITYEKMPIMTKDDYKKVKVESTNGGKREKINISIDELPY